MSTSDKNIVNKPQPDYEKAEMDLLREGLRRSHKERFLFLMTLIKVQNTFNKAKITHKTFPKP
jgi:hypothetical protein